MLIGGQYRNSCFNRFVVSKCNNQASFYLSQVSSERVIAARFSFQRSFNPWVNPVGVLVLIIGCWWHWTTWRKRIFLFDDKCRRNIPFFGLLAESFLQWLNVLGSNDPSASVITLDALGSLEITHLTKQTFPMMVEMVFLDVLSVRSASAASSLLYLDLSLRFVDLLLHVLDLLHHEIETLVGIALWILNA